MKAKDKIQLVILYLLQDSRYSTIIYHPTISAKYRRVLIITVKGLPLIYLAIHNNNTKDRIVAIIIALKLRNNRSIRQLITNLIYLKAI